MEVFIPFESLGPDDMDVLDFHPTELVRDPFSLPSLPSFGLLLFAVLQLGRLV